MASSYISQHTTLESIIHTILKTPGTIYAISTLGGLILSDEIKKTIPDELLSGRAFIKHLIINKSSPYHQLNCVLVYTNNYKQLLCADPKKIIEIYNELISDNISSLDPVPFDNKP